MLRARPAALTAVVAFAGAAGAPAAASVTTLTPASAYPAPEGTLSTVLLAAPGAPWSWEPGIARDAAGVLYVSGNHCFPADEQGLCLVDATGNERPDAAPVWRSTDGGRHWQYLGDPLRLPVNVAGQPQTGGEDTDVAAMPDAPSGAPPLVAVTSAWAVSSSLALSADAGRSFVVATLGGVPFQDRPWLLAQGRCDLYLEYHLLTGATNVASVPRVDHYDACALRSAALAGNAVAAPLSSTLVEPVADELTRSAQDMAHIVASRGRIIVAHLDCDSGQPADLDCTNPGDHQSVRVAVSDDSARTFNDVTLPDAGLHGSLNDGVWPLSAASDGAGGVWVASTDVHHVHLWHSGDDGHTWTLRTQSVDAPLGWSLATVPAVAATPGELIVAWYGSGAPEGGEQRWRLMVARSVDSGKTFTYSAVEPVLAVTPAGAPLVRGLYDDFGASAQPDGSAVIAVTQSCDGHTAADPGCPGAPAGALGTFDIVRATYMPPVRGGAAAAPPQGAVAPPRGPTPNTSGVQRGASVAVIATIALLAVAAGRRRRMR